MFQTLSQGECLQAPNTPVSPTCILQPLRSTGKGGVVSTAHFYQEGSAGPSTGISFVSSTSLRVCRNQRILIHKTFKGLVECEKCSMEWFFGFKLRLIINEKGRC